MRSARSLATVTIGRRYARWVASASGRRSRTASGGRDGRRIGMATATTRSLAALRASAPTRVRDVLAGPVLPGTLLGTFRTAVYVRVPAGFGVIALLTRDAVRVPCGLQLPWSS